MSFDSLNSTSPSQGRDLCIACRGFPLKAEGNYCILNLPIDTVPKQRRSCSWQGGCSSNDTTKMKLESEGKCQERANEWGQGSSPGLQHEGKEIQRACAGSHENHLTTDLALVYSSPNFLT